MNSLTQEGQKYPLNSNKRLVKCQHTHTTTASALPYSGTRQEYHRFHYGSPLPVREVSTETEDPGGAGKVALPEATGFCVLNPLQATDQRRY